LPIDIRLTAVPAPAGTSLAARLAALTGGADDGADVVVAVQDAETAGLDPYLGGPAADVLAACDATGKAGEVTPAVMWDGGTPRRLWFLGLGDGSAAEAALFLREFTGGRPWAHLDIAGAARFSPDGDEAKGATGFGTGCWLCELGAEAPPLTA